MAMTGDTRRSSLRSVALLMVVAQIIHATTSVKTGPNNTTATDEFNVEDGPSNPKHEVVNTSHGGDNSASPDLEMEKLQWSLGSVVCCFFALAACCLVPCFCFFYRDNERCLLLRNCEFKAAPAIISADSLLPLDTAQSRPSIESEVDGELILALALPFGAAGVTQLAAFAGGNVASSTSSYVLMAGFAIRSFGKDLELSRRHLLARKPPDHIEPIGVVIQKDLMRVPTSPLLMSKLELVDAVSDGAAWTAVRILEANDPLFTPRLIYAWSHGGWMSHNVAVGIESIGLSGCMMLCLGGALLAQWGAAHQGSNNRRTSIRADIAGLGAVGEALFESQNSLILAGEECFHDQIPIDTTFKLFLLHTSRIIGEGLPQLLWQSSAIMAMDKALFDNPMLALSLALTLATTAKKGIDLCRPEANLSDRLSQIGGIIILLFVFYFVTKLTMAQICQSHEWNLAFPIMQGCVEMPY